MAPICRDPGSHRDAVFVYNDGNAIFFGPSNVPDDVSAGDNTHIGVNRGICRPLSAPDRGEYEH